MASASAIRREIQINTERGAASHLRRRLSSKSKERENKGAFPGRGNEAGVATAAVGNGVDGPRRLRAGTAARGGGPPGSRQHRSQEPRCGRNLNVRRQTSKET